MNESNCWDRKLTEKLSNLKTGWKLTRMKSKRAENLEDYFFLMDDQVGEISHGLGSHVIRIGPHQNKNHMPTI